MLAYLASNPGRVISRRNCCEKSGSAPTARARLTFICPVAANSATTVESPRFLHVHRGVGIGVEDAEHPGGKPRLMYRRLIYFWLAVCATA